MNKILTISVFLLVASMMGFPNQIYAESESEYLIRLATQAQERIKIELTNMESVPKELVELYDKGSVEVDALVSTSEDKNVEASRTHFLSAMKTFNEIGMLISQQPSVAEVALAQSTDITFGVKPVIDRMERYVERLKGITEKNNVDIDFEALDELIITARNNYDKGDFATVQKTIEILESLTLDVYNTLKDDADLKKTHRAKDFAERQIQRIDVLIVQAKDLGLSENITKNLEQSKLKLTQASDSDQIVKQTKIIISIKSQVDESKASRIDSIIKELETKINRLSTQNADKTTISKAKLMLDELKTLVTDDKLDDAFKIFTDLRHLLNDLTKNSTKPIDAESRKENTQRESTTPQKSNDKDSDQKNTDRESLSDSKTERIKMKIKQLENELETLEQKAGNNAAAKRWIKNSYLLLNEAKSQVDESPDKALDNISEVEKILSNLHRMIR